MRWMNLALLALSVAAPASAQITDRGWTPGRSAPSISGPSTIGNLAAWRDLADVREQIDRGRDSGTLSRREARGLRREARLIGAVADRYGRDGFSDSEMRELELRTRALRDRTNIQRLRGR